MDSKKLGMFAAAALTVLSTQAMAGNASKAAKADGEMACSNGCKAGDHDCAGHELRSEKTQAACESAKGKWMAKKDIKAAAKDAGSADKAHKH